MFRTQRLKTSLILLSTIFLSSCQSIPWPDRDTERCVLKLDPVQIEGQTLWSGKCRCHSYRISPNVLGRVSESVDHSVEYCKRLTGFRPEEWTDFFVTWFEELQLWNHKNTKVIEESVND